MGFYNQYFFILKYENIISPNIIELYETNNYYPQSNISNIYSFKIDIKKDNIYTYNFFDFIYQPYLIIFSNTYCQVTIRKSKHKENDVLKFYNLDDKIIEVNNTNKIVLISGINIEILRIFIVINIILNTLLIQDILIN